MIPRQYYFIRHAAPDDGGYFQLNRFDRMMLGELDDPLSEKGKRQAAAMREIIGRFGIECIVSSTQKRAVESARIISRETDIPFAGTYEGLCEINLGSCTSDDQPFLRLFRGVPWPYLMRKVLEGGLVAAMAGYYYLQWYRGQTAGGESMDQIYRRIIEMLAELDRLPESRIAVIGHAGWISFLALKLLGESQWNLLRLSRVANCSITRVDADGAGAYDIRFFAQTPNSLPWVRVLGRVTRFRPGALKNGYDATGGQAKEQPVEDRRWRYKW